MRLFINISNVLIISSMVVYFIFGDSCNNYWDAIYFCTWNYVSFYLCLLVINKYKDIFLNIFLKIIMGVSLFKLLFSFYSLFDSKVYEKLNNSIHASAVIVSCILIFLIYRKYGLSKR